MNIVYVTRGAAPRVGGIQSHLEKIASSLAGGGHAVTVFASRIDNTPFNRSNTLTFAQRFDAFDRAGVATKPLPLTSGDRLRMGGLLLSSVPAADKVFGYHRVRERTLPAVVRTLAPRLAAAFRGADVVHAMGGEAQAHAALAAARTLGIPFVVTPFAHPGHWGDDDLNLRLYRSADAVVALLRGELSWLHEAGVAPQASVVIGVPAPEPPAPPLPEIAGGDGPLVLCLGVKRRYKYKLLLDALPHLSDPAIRVAFIGPETAEWAADARPDPRIISKDKVDDREKWSWIAAADVLCLPSVSEIMPVSILEAWQIGRPVVVARGRWTVDLVEDGRDGLIVGPEPEALATALEEVLADPRRAAAMGEAGRAKVKEQYVAAAVSAAHLRLYESLVGAKG